VFQSVSSVNKSNVGAGRGCDAGCGEVILNDFDDAALDELRDGESTSPGLPFLERFAFDELDLLGDGEPFEVFNGLGDVEPSNGCSSREGERRSDGEVARGDIETEDAFFLFGDFGEAEVERAVDE
jgi:hypothetical protein